VCRPQSFARSAIKSHRAFEHYRFGDRK